MGPIWWLSIYKPFVVLAYGYSFEIDSGGIEVVNWSSYASIYSPWLERLLSPNISMEWTPQQPVTDWKQLRQELGFDFAFYSRSDLSNNYQTRDTLFMISIWLVSLVLFFLFFIPLAIRFLKRYSLYQKDIPDPLAHSEKH